MPTDFRAATDLLLRCVTADDLAAELGVSRNTIARARMEPDSPNRRPPPPGWEAAVQRLAERHSGELAKLAKQLKRAARPSS